MKSPLRVLHLEDDQNDADLVLSALETKGIVCKANRVEARADFAAAINGRS